MPRAPAEGLNEVPGRPPQASSSDFDVATLSLFFYLFNGHLLRGQMHSKSAWAGGSVLVRSGPNVATLSPHQGRKPFSNLGHRPLSGFEIPPTKDIFTDFDLF